MDTYIRMPPSSVPLSHCWSIVMVLHTSMSQVFLPPSNPTFHLIPHLIEECITPKCTVGIVAIGRRLDLGDGGVGRNRGNDAVFIDTVFIELL